MLKTKELLYKLGIKPHIKGFNQLVYLIENFSTGTSLEKLYKEAMLLYDEEIIEYRIVSRTMNYAIKRAYENSENKMYWERLYFYDAPTVKTFVATAKDYLEEEKFNNVN